jgi:hypothetical protein
VLDVPVKLRKMISSVAQLLRGYHSDIKLKTRSQLNLEIATFFVILLININTVHTVWLPSGTCINLGLSIGQATA